MTTSAAPDEYNGTVGRAYEDGKPVIYKFVNELPPAGTRKRLPWLTVIEWQYDGEEHNGMPSPAEREQMMRLEDAINGIGEKRARHAYSRTGNDLKELVYYIEDRERFMAAFNEALRNHPRYPLEINFYHDPQWQELRTLLDDFSGAAQKEED